jgi:hypothetical protein
VSTRIPLAQPLTLDFNVVSVRNASRALSLLGAASAADLAKLQAALSALSAQVAAGSGVPAHSHALPEHSHLSLGSVVSVSDTTRRAGVNASAPSAALEVRQPDGATAGLKVAASDGTARLVVDEAGRVGVGPTGALTVPMKVLNSGSGATLRVEGPVTGGYATSGVVEVLNGGTVQGAFDGAAVGDGYGLFNFFGSPDASRFGELNFLDRSAGGDRRACTLYVNSLGETTGEFGLVMRNGGGFAYGLTINAAGQIVAGGNTLFTSTCFLETANGFFHQGGELGFFGVGPTTQQSVATSDIAFSCPAPSTPDYSFAATSGGYGFSSADQFNSCMAVIAALQSRINEIIGALQTYGLLA